MLTRPQIILLKRAQQQARIDDDEYRQALEMLSKLPACRSSKDPRLGDAHLDLFLKYFEGIYWRAIDLQRIAHAPKPNDPFRARGFWAAKNPASNTSRDRYTEIHLHAEISALEWELSKLGYGFKYFDAIKNKIHPFSLMKYKVALTRTYAAKRKPK